MLVPSKTKELLDLKIMCFDGKPKFIVLHRNITSNDNPHTLNMFTLDWKPIDVEWDCLRYSGDIECPKNLKEIICLAEKLADGYIHVRVDFLLCDNEVYFGELTLYPGAGFKPFSTLEFDEQLGRLINLESIYEKNGTK